MIYLIGIGAGNKILFTGEALDAVSSSDILIGSKRALESVRNDFKGIIYEEVISDKILDLIENHKDKNISVLFSGDTGFYSGSKKIAEKCKEKTVIIPGISSLSYFASKIKRSYENVKLVSAHGKKIDTTAYILTNKEVFFLTGGEITPEFIIKDAFRKGLKDIIFYVGEKLSYEDERVISGSASELLNVKFDSLSAVWCVNEHYFERKSFSFDMPDSEFIKEDVPITKRDIRNAVILELKLSDEGVFYDIGGGTGSVSVAVSKVSPFINTYIIEKNDKALDVIKRNFLKHRVINGNIVKAAAPAGLEDLPIPDYAFIGGSSGNIEDIIKALIAKNPNVRVVITALTLETVVDIKNALNNLKIESWHGRQILVSDIKKLGNYNALIAQNPIFIFSFGGNNEI